jgi:hypothetical protein
VASLDYERYGRQIALAELGPHGQTRLAHSTVRFEARSEVVTLAIEMHTRAGGHCDTHDAAIAFIRVHLPSMANGSAEPLTVGMAAWAAVEAARRTLEQPPSEIPKELLERLSSPDC